MIQVLLGAGFAAAIGYGAYRARALSHGGAVAAFAVGTAIFGVLGFRGALTLLAFFVPSVLLTRVGAARKRALRGIAESAPRNAWQVLANGAVAALCAIGASNGGDPLRAAFAGAFAAACADTWGTEIGTLALKRPVSILTFRPIEAGLSGGVSVPGTAATVAGALFIACIASLLGLAPFGAVAAGGIAGALLDSIAGASLQALRWCPRCARECETLRHICGTLTTVRRGVSWIQNDAVNLIATLCGALIAGILAR